MLFGENTVILGASAGRRQMGNRGYPGPKRPHRHASECIFVSPKLLAVEIWTHMRVSEPYWWHGNCNYPFAGAPQNDRVFTEMHQSAQNTLKWGKIRLLTTFGPPTLAGAARSAEIASKI